MWLQGIALRQGGRGVGLFHQPSPAGMERLESRAFDAIEQLVPMVGPNGEKIVVSARKWS